ncbi:hypothetical protein JW826_06350 [Candidatus Woesearchaeota archaeon]|nr:hypothetical protein [Candidatus Woesearchaeota archaeon]
MPGQDISELVEENASRSFSVKSLIGYVSGELLREAKKEYIGDPQDPIYQAIKRGSKRLIGNPRNAVEELGIEATEIVAYTILRRTIGMPDPRK